MQGRGVSFEHRRSPVDECQCPVIVAQIETFSPGEGVQGMGRGWLDGLFSVTLRCEFEKFVNFA